MLAIVSDFMEKTEPDGFEVYILEGNVQIYYEFKLQAIGKNRIMVGENFSILPRHSTCWAGIRTDTQGGIASPQKNLDNKGNTE